MVSGQRQRIRDTTRGTLAQLPIADNRMTAQMIAVVLGSTQPSAPIGASTPAGHAAMRLSNVALLGPRFLEFAPDDATRTAAT